MRNNCFKKIEDMGNMNDRNTLISGVKLMTVATALAMTACSTVRDATDWVPGVDSNEEIQAEKNKQVQKAKAKEHEAYVDKAAFAPTNSSASDADAKINVSISKKYAEDNHVKREDIGIEVNAGVVTLTGSVDSDEAAIRAISIAKNSAGVSRVISKLVVIQLRKNKEE